MNNLGLKVLPLFIILLGIMFVTLIDQGSGLSSPGFWLIPAGAVLAVSLIIREKGLKRAKLPLIAWGLTFSFIIGLFVDLDHELVFEGWGVFWWAYLIVVSAFIAIVSTAIILFKKN